MEGRVEWGGRRTSASAFVRIGRFLTGEWKMKLCPHLAKNIGVRV